MYRTRVLVATAATLAVVFSASDVAAQDESRSVAGGGIDVPGWMGKIDAREAERGSTLEDARLSMEGDGMHVTTGPAVAYWHPDNQASGDYTVSATFHEAEYMNLNNHPHPYGIMIAGNDLGTDQQSYLYCAAYGNGSFIVRGFGPDAFQMNGRRAEANDAVDIIFVVDDSGSMEDDQQQVREAADAMGSILTAAQIDFRLGVARHFADEIESLYA